MNTSQAPTATYLLEIGKNLRLQKALYELTKYLFIFAMTLSDRPTQAESGANYGPLYNVDEVSVQILVGNTLSIGNNAQGLFGNDHWRSDNFEKNLSGVLSEALRSGGLRVNSRAAVVLDVSFFGGKFQGNDSRDVFYMMEVSVCRSGGGLCCPAKVVLGRIDDADLERDLIDAATIVVDQFILQRKRYRDDNLLGEG